MFPLSSFHEFSPAANLAIAVHPEVEYALVKYKRNEDWHVTVVASDLVQKVMRANQRSAASS